MATFSTCGNCEQLVDGNGDWLGDCAARGMPGECDECGACYCDGSC